MFPFQGKPEDSPLVIGWNVEDKAFYILKNQTVNVSAKEKKSLYIYFTDILLLELFSQCYFRCNMVALCL